MQKNVLVVLAILAVLMIPSTSYSATPQEQKKFTDFIQTFYDGDIKPVLDKVNSTGGWTNVDKVSISVDDDGTLDQFLVSNLTSDAWIPIVYNGSIVNGSVIVVPPMPDDNHTMPDDNDTTEPEPKEEVCGDGIDNNGNGEADEGCPIVPPPDPNDIPDAPKKDVNTSEIFRVAAVGDIDNGNGLDKMLDVMNDYGVQILIIPGDYAYDSASGVIKRLSDAGFDKSNTALILGNHDSKSTTNNFNGRTVPYGTWNLDPDGKVAIFGLDGNSGLDCTGTQFKAMKDQISSSDGWYNIAVIHQPFVMSESGGEHGPNGKFSCYDPVFRANGVDMVLQAHEHNYQRYDVNGLEYFVTGGGNHDGPDGEDGALYKLGSKTFKGFDCLRCLNSDNGFNIFDFKIDDPHQRNVNGWWMTSDGDVKDKFNLRD